MAKDFLVTDPCPLTRIFINLDEVEESLRAEGWKSSREVAAAQAAREYLEYIGQRISRIYRFSCP